MNDLVHYSPQDNIAASEVAKGMPSWAEVVSSEDSETIRAFIVFMANQ